MAAIQLSVPEFYAKGIGGSSALVGNDYGTADGFRVARYTFTAPATGAAHVELKFTGLGATDGIKVPSLRFFIGTDPDSHALAGPDDPYTADLTREDSANSYLGSADMLLIPNATYYLWVFPAKLEYAFVYWHRYTDAEHASLESSGHAGAARIGAEGKRYLCAIGQADGSKRLYLPCVYDAAAGEWKLQS